MIDMSTLFPPLESDNAMTATTMTMGVSMTRTNQEEDSFEDSNNNIEYLSPELTHNFDTLRSLLDNDEPIQLEDDDDDINDDNTESEDITNADSNNKRRRKTAQALAIETALLVESEVAHLQNGIRELEALLMASQTQQSYQGRQQRQPLESGAQRRSNRRRRRRIDASAQQHHAAEVAADNDDEENNNNDHDDEERICHRCG